MFQRKRRPKTINNNNNRKLVFTVIFFVVLASITGAFIYHFIAFSSITIINPLSKSRNTFDSKLKQQLENSNIKYDSASSNLDGSETIKLDGGGSVIFAQNKPISHQIASLQLLMSRLTIEGRKLKSLDFRYASPVVSFN